MCGFHLSTLDLCFWKIALCPMEETKARSCVTWLGASVIVQQGKVWWEEVGLTGGGTEDMGNWHGVGIWMLEGFKDGFQVWGGALSSSSCCEVSVDFYGERNIKITYRAAYPHWGYVLRPQVTSGCWLDALAHLVGFSWLFQFPGLQQFRLIGCHIFNDNRMGL